MKKSTSTKRALTLSVVSLLVCAAVFIGSTFAWFTDSASVNVSSIRSGKLDVQLLDENDNNIEGKTLEWKKADGHETEAVLWEPGCTYELPAVKVKNNGSLALKYKIAVNGVKGDSKLLEVIEFTYGGLDISTEGYLAAGEETGLLTVSAHMKETANNDYQNLSIEGINLTVYATQDTVEYDSESNQYDADARNPEIVDTVDSFKSSAQNGGLLTLTASIDMKGSGGSEQVIVKKDATVDFNGNTLKGTLACGTSTSSDPTVDVVIKDDSNQEGYSISAAYRKESTGAMMQAFAIAAWKPTVTIESGKYTCNNGVVLCQIQGVYDKPGVVINGGTFDATDSGSCVADIIGKVVINDGIFNAQEEGDCVYVKPGDSKQESCVEINGGTFNASGNAFTINKNFSGTGKVVINGGTFNVGQLLADGSEGSLVIKGGTFNVDPTSYVAEGYTAVNTGAAWVVQAN